MGLKLRDLRSGKRDIEVEFAAGAVLHLCYDPNVFNGAMEKEVNALRAAGEPLRALAVQLARAILDWDLVDDADKRIEPEEEVLSSLGLAVLSAIHVAIAQDLAPNPRSARPSRAG